MRINFLKKMVIVMACIYLPFHTMAWGVLGHRVVGQIAEAYLTKKAKKSIAAILGNESVAMSSNWMDFIKSDTAYRYLYNWHFANIKGGMSQKDVISLLESDTSTNAYTKINFIVKELKNNQLSLPDKQLYLRSLIHLVGDIHQPMHVGRLEDLGGNRVKVLWFNDPSNLHQVWDEKLIELQQLSYTEYAAAINFTNQEQRKAWQAEPLSLWFYQSYQHAEKIYADVKGADEKLGYNYNFKYIKMLDEQLLKGGVRLAGLLNDIFR